MRDTMAKCTYTSECLFNKNTNDSPAYVSGNTEDLSSVHAIEKLEWKSILRGLWSDHGGQLPFKKADSN